MKNINLFLSKYELIASIKKKNIESIIRKTKEDEQKRREIKQPEILQQARPCNFPAFRFEYSVTNSPSSMYFITRPLNSSSAWSTASV